MGVGGNEGAVGPGNLPRGVSAAGLRVRARAPAALDSLDANVAPCGTWAHPRWPADWVPARSCRVRGHASFGTSPCHLLFFLWR